MSGNMQAYPIWRGSDVHERVSSHVHVSRVISIPVCCEKCLIPGLCEPLAESWTRRTFCFNQNTKDLMLTFFCPDKAWESTGTYTPGANLRRLVNPCKNAQPINQPTCKLTTWSVELFSKAKKTFFDGTLEIMFSNVYKGDCKYLLHVNKRRNWFKPWA